MIHSRHTNSATSLSTQATRSRSFVPCRIHLCRAFPIIRGKMTYRMSHPDTEPSIPRDRNYYALNGDEANMEPKRELVRVRNACSVPSPRRHRTRIWKPDRWNLPNRGPRSKAGRLQDRTTKVLPIPYIIGRGSLTLKSSPQNIETENFQVLAFALAMHANFH